MQVQWQKVFWDATSDRRLTTLPLAPTEGDIRYLVGSTNTQSPLNKIIYGEENEGNMRILRRFAFTAMKRNNHSCRGCNFGIYAQSGQGKTYVVKQFAKMVGIPFVFVQSTAISDTARLFDMICEEFNRFEDGRLPIVPYKPIETTKADYTLPPMIVFFDEAHALPKKMMTGGLLNAMEADDGHMIIKHGSGSVLVDCKNVCWIVATTEKGKLFDAFANRLSTDIEWRSAKPEQVSLIVKQKMDARLEEGEIPFTMPVEACLVAARYRRVPREAINFSLKMIQQVDMVPSDSWRSSADKVAVEIGLDQWGMSEKQVVILSALGQRPIAENRLATVAKCRIEQVARYELPMLMDYSNGGPLIISLSGRGMCITQSGLRELDKRNINHNGNHVTAEYFEKRRVA